MYQATLRVNSNTIIITREYTVFSKIKNLNFWDSTKVEWDESKMEG